MIKSTSTTSLESSIPKRIKPLKNKIKLVVKNSEQPPFWGLGVLKFHNFYGFFETKRIRYKKSDKKLVPKVTMALSFALVFMSKNDF